MIVRVKCEYSGDWQKVPKETYDILRERHPDKIEEPFEKRKTYGNPELLMQVTDLAILDFGGANINIKPLKYLDVPAEPNLSSDKLAENNYEGLKKLFKAATHVHLPGAELINIREAMILEDACTEDLDGHLKDKWRIIAVCPQTGHRRPDYVLGRFTRSKDEPSEVVTKFDLPLTSADVAKDDDIPF